MDQGMVTESSKQLGDGEIIICVVICTHLIGLFSFRFFFFVYGYTLRFIGTLPRRFVTKFIEFDLILILYFLPLFNYFLKFDPFLAT